MPPNPRGQTSLWRRPWWRPLYARQHCPGEPSFNGEPSADSLDDRGLKFPAAVASHKHFVGVKADTNGVASSEFAGSVAVGGLTEYSPT